MIRKSYTREFKIRAVQLMKESSKPIRKLADELGVSIMLFPVAPQVKFSIWSFVNYYFSLFSIHNNLNS
jgi:hypothetical protein